MKTVLNTLFRSSATWIFLLFFISFNLGCTKSKKPSVIVITVDQLTPYDFNCQNDDESSTQNSGFNLLCKNSIRFTHNFTNSLNPTVALVSLLSGLHPVESQFHSSSQRYQHLHPLAQQIAKENNYKTAFFGGNPHLLKKHGVSNYFDFWDDSSSLNTNQFYKKSFKSLQQNIFDWINETEEPFFIFITISDLSDLNKLNNRNNEIENFDEALFDFINDLKEKKIWDNSYFILTGLKGENRYERTQETVFTNLHTENIQTVAFIKKPQSFAETDAYYKSDLQIQLSDLGYTLKYIFKNSLQKNKQNKEELIKVGSQSNNSHSKTSITASSIYLEKSTEQTLLFKKVNILDTLNSPASQIQTHRPMIIESPNGWNETSFSQIQLALVFKNILGIFQSKKSEYYNQTTDILETIPLNLNDIPNDTLTLFKEYIQYFLQNSIILSDKVSYSQNKLTMSFLTNQLNLTDTKVLKEITPNNPLHIVYIAHLFKTQSLAPEILNKLNVPFQSCLNALTKKNIKLNFTKKCDDELLSQYIKFKRAEDLNLKIDLEKLKYELIKQRYIEQIKLHIFNLAFDNIWSLYKSNQTWYNPVIYLDPQLNVNLTRPNFMIQPL